MMNFINGVLNTLQQVGLLELLGGLFFTGLVFLCAWAIFYILGRINNYTITYRPPEGRAATPLELWWSGLFFGTSQLFRAGILFGVSLIILFGIALMLVAVLNILQDPESIFRIFSSMEFCIQNSLLITGFAMIYWGISLWGGLMGYMKWGHDLIFWIKRIDILGLPILSAISLLLAVLSIVSITPDSWIYTIGLLGVCIVLGVQFVSKLSELED